MGNANSNYLSNIDIFHFHDYRRQSNISLWCVFVALKMSLSKLFGGLNSQVTFLLWTSFLQTCSSRFVFGIIKFRVAFCTRNDQWWRVPLHDRVLFHSWCGVSWKLKWQHKRVAAFHGVSVVMKQTQTLQGFFWGAKKLLYSKLVISFQHSMNLWVLQSHLLYHLICIQKMCGYFPAILTASPNFLCHISCSIPTRHHLSYSNINLNITWFIPNSYGFGFNPSFLSEGPIIG